MSLAKFYGYTRRRHQPSFNVLAAKLGWGSLFLASAGEPFIFQLEISNSLQWGKRMKKTRSVLRTHIWDRYRLGCQCGAVKKQTWSGVQHKHTQQHHKVHRLILGKSLSLSLIYLTDLLWWHNSVEKDSILYSQLKLRVCFCHFKLGLDAGLLPLWNILSKQY